MPNGLTPITPLSATGKEGIQYINGNFGGWARGVLYDRTTAGTSSSKRDLAYKLPNNSRVISVALRCVTAGTIATGTSLAVGYSDTLDGGAADPDAFLDDATFTSYDAVGDALVVTSAVSTTFIAGAKTIALYSTNGSGTAAGDISTAVYDIAILFETFAGWNVAT